MAEAEIARALAREVAAWCGGTPAQNSLSRLSGGQSSACYRFELDEPPAGAPRALVLRLMRDDASAVHECRIQRAAAAQGLPVPAIHHTGSAASAFGRPFSIMAFVDGRDPLSFAAMRRLPLVLAETMRDIHATRIEPTERDIAAIVSDLGRSERPEIVAAARWFDDNGFDPARFVPCHGDLHAENLVVRDGRVVAVLDWEIAAFAPREYDVARSELLLRLMPGVGSGLLRPLVRLLGRRVARQFIAAYEAHVPLDAPVLRRCRALHALRLVALLRTPGDAADGVRALWRPFERELASQWRRLTGVEIANSFSTA